MLSRRSKCGQRIVDRKGSRRFPALLLMLAAASMLVRAEPPAPPTLTSISPAFGAQGAKVSVTLSGTNFVPGAMLAMSSSAIAVSGLTVVSATQITATFTVSSGAALGAVRIVVITSGGASSPANFTVNPPPPTLISVSPASGVQGGSVPVTLTGANFVSGATVASSNPGVTASGVTVVSPTQLTATFTIAVNAALGTANVTVTTSGGTSAAVAFTVSPPPPALTSVSPASGVQGGSVPVTLTGANFLSGATVATSNAGITVGSVTVVSLTQITATFIVAANAAFGAANVTVTTAGGTSAPAAFTVTGAPVITSLWPTSGPAGTAVTIAGANFGATQGASTVAFNGTVAGTASSWSDTAIVMQVPGGASTGNVVVTAGGVASSGTLFTVTTPPAITNLWPTSGPVGMAVTITGANFGASQGTSTVTFGGAGAGSAPYWSATSITVTVPSGAATGNVVVHGEWPVRQRRALHSDEPARHYQPFGIDGRAGRYDHHFRDGFRIGDQARPSVARQHLLRQSSELERHAGGGHGGAHFPVGKGPGAAGRSLV